MNVAAKLVEILEDNGVRHIFGIPGEQILAFYEALSNSDIEHILMKHEQSAAHAADGYMRSSGKFGVCISTASPGALNMVMATATAFKDNVPILVITGDNSTSSKYLNHFQSFPLSNVFKNLTYKSYDPETGSEAIANLIEIMEIFSKEPCGPIHLNLSKDILLEEDYEIINEDYEEIYDDSNLTSSLEKIKKSKKPLLILGSGARESNISKLAINSTVPVTTTFPGKGIVSEYEKINLGLSGVRASNQANYALDESDCVIAIGTRLSERTLLKDVSKKLIHVNIDKKVLQGKYKLHMSSNNFVENLELPDSKEWLDEILKIENDEIVKGADDYSIPLKPQSAIKSILNKINREFIVSDAGSHTFWTMILSKCVRPGQLLFSGALAPMGYGLPAAIGTTIATGDKAILINGDGDFQMSIHELAVVASLNLPIIICIINNSSLCLIKQTQRNNYKMKPFAVDFENPDFLKIANAYNIESSRVESKEELENVLDKVVKLDKPYLIDIIVKQEDVPLP